MNRKLGLFVQGIEVIALYSGETHVHQISTVTLNSDGGNARKVITEKK